jgi:2,5-diketo-D-gluconate reductase B
MDDSYDVMTPLVKEGEGEPHPLLADGADLPDQFGSEPVATLRSGSVMPLFGVGTWQTDGREATDAVASALDRGVRHVDTAQMYRNEGAVGRGIVASGVERDDIFVTTKIDNDNHEPHRLVESIEQSLRELGTDYVDLLLIHWPTEFDRMGATLSTLAQVQASGLAHHIGLSNFTIEQLNQIHHLAPLEVLQIELHPYLQQRSLRRWCQRHHWVVTAHSPLGQGTVLRDPSIVRIAQRHEVEPGAVVLAWAMATGSTVIPRTSSLEHLDANRRALWVVLSDVERSEIERLDRAQRFVDPADAPR